MVCEIAPAILGPLPLTSHPKSRPFTPCAVVTPVYEAGAEPATPLPVCILRATGGRHARMTTSDDHRTLSGRYRLVRSIGQGGMGTVWEAHDEVLNRSVAVKEVRFPSELGDAEVADLRERTMREARATARLSHPNVVTTYDVVEEDDRPWIVMELLSTRTLAELMRDAGPLPPHR